MPDPEKKTFTVTIINNETIAFDVEATDENEAREFCEGKTHQWLKENCPSRIVDSEYTIDEITGN